MSDASRFEIRYGLFKPLLVLLGLGPRFSRLEIDGTDVVVVMGWAFRTRIPLATIIDVAEAGRAWGGIGVHGWAEHWLVNGATSGIVAIEVDPPARAWLGVLPIRVRRLRVSMVDPGATVATLTVLGAHHR